VRSPAYVVRYLVPKQGNPVEQCEDAVVVIPEREPADEIEERVVAVLCDGASESLLARDWARLLAGRVAERQSGAVPAAASVRRTASAIMAATDAWEEWLDAYLKQREATGRPLAWYERPGLERGAYATLLAVALDPPAPRMQVGDELMTVAEAVAAAGSRGWHWHAAALGDTCLFHVRDERLLRAFPVEDSSAFGTNPPLAASRNADKSVLARHIKVAEGWCESGDQLYLATDALAAWFLQAVQAGASPWTVLRDFAADGHEAFEAFVAEQRALGSLHNDDVALVHIDIG
jgi:hypothetical protein